MKKKINFAKVFASVAMAFGVFAGANAQTNLGASCGCPPVGSRGTTNVSGLPGAVAIAGDPDAFQLTAGATFTCNTTYILDKKIYVPSGQTLNIAAGTVIKGAAAALPVDQTALVIERGGKINAMGTEDCPIVFTANADNLDGTFPITTVGSWGGVVILGRATNNLVAGNTPQTFGSKVGMGVGVGLIEGFNNTGAHNRYGVLQSGVVSGETIGTFNDDDNSGIMKYVSIRHTGAILEVGAEINGLTLGSVGRGTTLEHIEIVSGADDMIELFGGNVNLKWVTTLFGNDDMLDYDHGWSGKIQFFFGMKNDGITTGEASPDNDNGIEADSDDNNVQSAPVATPTIFNSTFMGNAKVTGTADNRALAAINAKDGAGGAIYNSVFAFFKNGLNIEKALGARTLPLGGNAWHNWYNVPATPAVPTATTGNGTLNLKVKCNHFVGVTNPLIFNGSNIAANGTALTAGTASDVGIANGAEFTQFTTTDLNVIVSGNTLPGFNYNFTRSGNTFTVKNDPTPNPALSVAGCPVAPVDGFFEPANYRGAFSSTFGDNWLSTWSYANVLGASRGIVACPTDLNFDGQTNVNDFLIFAPAFGTSCN
jgi:hypothetical protein